MANSNVQRPPQVIDLSSSKQGQHKWSIEHILLLVDAAALRSWLVPDDLVSAAPKHQQQLWETRHHAKTGAPIDQQSAYFLHYAQHASTHTETCLAATQHCW
eukprot:GHRR01028475.1.p2 GENE.GHRR01028475.1~~GHRR01028475.1.p2  ORF type:complete len:102 (-),score=23.23 GHRR01028475.1:400-705(-)